MKHLARSCYILPMLLCATGAVQAEDNSVDTLTEMATKGKANRFQVKLKGLEIGQTEVMPGHLMAIDAGAVSYRVGQYPAIAPDTVVRLLEWRFRPCRSRQCLGLWFRQLQFHRERQ